MVQKEVRDVDRTAVRKTLETLAKELREQNRRERDAIGNEYPIVLFHSGAGWEGDEISGAFW